MRKEKKGKKQEVAAAMPHVKEGARLLGGGVGHQTGIVKCWKKRVPLTPWNTAMHAIWGYFLTYLVICGTDVAPLQSEHPKNFPGL